LVIHKSRLQLQLYSQSAFRRLSLGPAIDCTATGDPDEYAIEFEGDVYKMPLAERSMTNSSIATRSNGATEINKGTAQTTHAYTAIRTLTSDVRAQALQARHGEKVWPTLAPSASPQWRREVGPDSCHS